MFTDGYIFKDKNIEVNIDGYSITKGQKIDLGKTSPGLTKAVIGLDGILNLMTAEPISI